jgi:hypothetical protein
VASDPLEAVVFPDIGDTAQQGPESFSDTTRPATSTGYLPGQSIWNTDSNTLNYADGSGGWRDSDGNLT